MYFGRHRSHIYSRRRDLSQRIRKFFSVATLFVFLGLEKTTTLEIEKNPTLCNKIEPKAVLKNHRKTLNNELSYEDWPLSYSDRKCNYCENLPAPTQCYQDAVMDSLHGKRILLLGHALSFAGGEIWLRGVAELLEQAGAHVRILFVFDKENSRLDWSIFPSYEERGFSYLFWQRRKLNFSSFDFILANTVAIEHWFGFFKAVSAYTPPHMMKELNSRIIYCVHELFPNQFHNKFLFSHLPEVKLAVFPSFAAKSMWVNKIPALSSNSMVMNPGVSKQRFEEITSTLSGSKTEFRSRLHIPAKDANDVVILQVSSLIMKDKGITNLIEAFYLMLSNTNPHELRVRAWCLVIVGGGPDRTKAEKMASFVNTKIRSLGARRSKIILRNHTDDVAPYLGSCDVFVLNSEYESFGMVLVEAMLAARPTIARNVGGIREIINDNVTGVLLPNKGDNRVELADAMSSLTTSFGYKVRLDEMGKAARETAHHKFTYVAFARSLSRIFW